MRAPRSAAPLAVAALAALAFVGQFRMPLTSDVAFHLDGARRLLDGAVLYQDVAAPETPFVFWSAVPAAIAGGSGTTIGTAFRCMTIALTLALLGLIWRHTSTVPALRAGFVLMSLMLPVWYFGTPEYLAFVLLVPYFAVAVARLEGAGVPARLAPASGGLAAMAVALEPALVLVPFVLIAFECAALGALRVLRAAEHAALGAGLLVAILAVLFGAPHFRESWPSLSSTWAARPRPAIAALLVRDIHVWVVWFSLGAALVFGWAVVRRRRIAALALATVSALAAAVVQRTGEGPDFFPAAGFGVMLLLELTVAAPGTGAKVAAVRRVTAVALLLPFLYLFGAVTWRRAHAVFTRTRAEQLAAMRLMGNAPADVAVLSSDVADAYPGVLELRHRFVLRYPAFVAGFLPASHPAHAAILRHYGEDLRRAPPAAVVVRRPEERERREGEPDVNYLAVLCRDELAREVLSRYRFAERAGGFELYRTDAEGAAACVSS